MCVSIYNCNLLYNCIIQIRLALRYEQRLIYFFFVLLVVVVFSIVLFGLDWFLVNFVFGLVFRLFMFFMLCRLVRFLVFFREFFFFLFRISLSCRIKMLCRDLYLKYLVSLIDLLFLFGMENKNKIWITYIGNLLILFIIQ